MKKIIIILVVIVVFILFWFIPLIPYSHQVNCFIPPCPPETGTRTLKELMTNFIEKIHEKKLENGYKEEWPKYVGEYTSGNITIILTEDCGEFSGCSVPKAQYLKNGIKKEGRWNFNFYSGDENIPMIGLNFGDESFSLKVTEKYKRLLVTFSETKYDLLPINLELTRK